MKKWQQLKVTQGVDGSFLFWKAQKEYIDEILALANGDFLTTEHIGWAGWELVTVCKGSMYYKREMFVK